ncbi:DUF1778 domain-containing protein [Serratia marcescens]|nr:DUF1778 domain-containing protein [Serratia marcescens]
MMASTTSARLEARITPELRDMLKRAAELQGRSMTDFVISAVQEAAAKAIEQTTTIRLSMEDERRFAEALIHPPVANSALTRAFERHKHHFGREK